MEKTTLLVLLLSSCILVFTNCRKDSILEQIEGSYNVDEECASAVFDYTLSITSTSGGADRILIANYGDFGVAISGTLTDRFIEIDDQTFTFGNQQVRIFNALGEVDGNVFTSNYAYSIDGGAPELCTFTATKI